VMSDVIELKSKCKHTLYLRKHKCVKIAGLGYRCKYCGQTLFTLKQAERGK
jgi:predicted SprT family Zn-dependent metalloprotease